jgi:hypothetical protein
MKICLHCSIEKPLEEFAKYKGRDGESHSRNVCKDCFNLQTKKTKGTNNNQRERCMHNMNFNEDEIIKLKNIALKHNDIIQILNKKIELRRIDDNKVKKSISISETLHKKVLEICDKTNLNYSQAIEILVKSALEDV